MHIDGGDHTFAGTSNVVGEGSFLFSRDNLLVDAGGVLTFDLARSSLRLDGTNTTVGGEGQLINASHAIWSRSTIIASAAGFTNRGTLEITGTGTRRLETVMTNEGTVTHASAARLLMDSTIFNNAAGALYEFTSAGGVDSAGSTDNTFNNFGTLRKTSNSGTIIFDVVFVNSGVLDIQEGAIDFTRNLGRVSSCTLVRDSYLAPYGVGILSHCPCDEDIRKVWPFAIR